MTPLFVYLFFFTWIALIGSTFTIEPCTVKLPQFCTYCSMIVNSSGGKTITSLLYAFLDIIFCSFSEILVYIFFFIQSGGLTTESFMSKTDCRSGRRAPLTKLLYLGNENVPILSAITFVCHFDSNPCHYIIDIWDLTYIMTPVSSLCGLSFCSLPLFLFRFDIYWLIPISRTDYKWKTVFPDWISPTQTPPDQQRPEQQMLKLL